MAITLVGFISGAFIATFHMIFWWHMPSLGVISLGTKLGWMTAITAQLMLFGVIAWIVWTIERRYRPSRIRADEPESIGSAWLRVA